MTSTVALTLALCAASCMASHATAAATAATTATAARSTQPNDGDLRNHKFQQAEALYLSGRLQEATAAFEELTRAYPRDARVWLKYGNTLTKSGKLDGAATAFQTALAIDPTQGAAQLNLALVRLSQAQASLDSALKDLAVTSAEHAQAEALQHQLDALLGKPDPGAISH